MSFESDTSDIRLRQLKEEIEKIREEQFVSTLPTNNIGSPSLLNADSGVPAPIIGVTSTIPGVIRVTKDTGVIDLLDFDGKNPNKDFTIGETITGQSSGATATVGDIDTLTDTTGTLTLVPNSITGTFSDGENLNGSGAGGNNIADADGSQYTQTGRGHLNAGAGSIIAETKDISAPFEIHFIDGADQDGQTVYLRAQDGQTIRMRKPTTSDANTGNLDLDQSFDIVENAIVFFQYQVASNATPTGGWVPLITDVSAGVGTGGTAFQFPILYPKENLGTLNGVIDLALNQSDGHYKQITLDGDASLTFSNLPPAVNGFKFYVLTIQDGTGGHVYTDLPDSVIFEGVLLGQLQTAPNSQTLWQFSTADGGVNWHSAVINPQGSIGQNQTPWLSPIDADNFDLFNANQIRFSGSGNPFSCPTDSSVLGMAGSIIGLEWNVPLTGLYLWSHACKQFMQLERVGSTAHRLVMFDEGAIERLRAITFSHLVPIPALSDIRPDGLELKYSLGHGSGQGAFHGFHVANSFNAQFEIREDVIRANVDLDMITNDINNIDQAQFDEFGGFEPLVNHGERRITGGSLGISMNIPKITPFAGGFNIFFENDAQDNSDLIFRFEKDRLIMPTCAVIDSSLGYLLCNGGGLTDVATRVILNTGQNPSTFDPQILELAVSNLKKVEFTNLEDGTGGVGGGMKMFTDLNMQTQNINNVDVLDFEVDSGVGITGAPNGTNNIVAFDTSLLLHGDRPTFLFNIPPSLPSSQLAFSKFHQIFATFDTFSFQLHATGDTDQPFIIADGGFRYGASHLPAFVPVLDGDSKLINNSGSLDVVYRTGGNLVNLSDLTATGGLDIDNDLGTVGEQAVEIDWDVSNFHRMILDGDVTIFMNNLPDAGEWQEVTVQFLQDNDGGHEVSFIDVFTNGVVPRISLGTNRYTTVKFYSYDDGFERILAFNVVGQINELTEGEATPFFQGIIQARMASDQTSNTAVGDHLEFDTELFSDRINVSSGAGQIAGIFSGFVKGRTYECECAFAVSNSAIPAPSTMAVQWFDRATSTLIGTHGKATDIQLVDQFQQVSKAYFVPDDDGDTLEVQIIAVVDTDTVLSGSPPSTTTQRPMSYVTIKDCGISEDRFNEIIDEDLPEGLIPPPPAPIGFSARSVIYHNLQRANYTNAGNLPVDGAMVVPFNGENSLITPAISDNDEQIATGKFMATTPGRIRKIVWSIDFNSLNKDIVVTLMENEEEKETLFTITAGSAGTFEFPSTGTGNVTLSVGNKYWVRMQTVDEINPSGQLSGSLATEIYWGFAD
jgi:hypothetical protein